MPDEARKRLKVARDFLAGVELPRFDDTRYREFGGGGGVSGAAPGPGFEPDALKDQAVVAGADIISFTRGVTADRRAAITHSALLAQLVANQQVQDPARVEEWYRVYFKALTSLGWVIQRTDFNTYEALSDQADVHQVVLEIAAGALGGTMSTAYLVVKASVDALKKLDEKSPWISLFHRESQHTRSARFQVALANQEPGKDFLVTLLAFSLDASTSVTQVLLFKFRAERATLRQYSGAVTIDDAVLLACAPSILKKVAAFVQSYIEEIPDLMPAQP